MKLIQNGKDYFVINKDIPITAMQLTSFLSRDAGYSTSITDVKYLIGEYGNFNILKAYVNGIYYDNFSQICEPYDKITYTKSYMVDGEYITRFVYFDLKDGILYYNSKAVLNSPRNVLLDVPVILAKNEELLYKLTDAVIVEGGVGYSVGDVITMSVLSVSVTEVSKIGAITKVSKFSPTLLNKIYQVNYSGDYMAYGGKGYGAIIKVRTHYIVGTVLTTGKLFNTTKDDPVVQKSYIDTIVDDISNVNSLYSNNRVYTTSKLNKRNGLLELQYVELEDSDDPAVILDAGLTVENEGVYYRQNSNKYKLQTRQDVLDAIASINLATFVGKFTYFGNKESIELEQIAGTTALTNDTFESGIFNGTTWEWSPITLNNGSYAEIINFVDIPSKLGYCHGTVKYLSTSFGQEWLINAKYPGDADNITLQENEDGTLGIKLNSDNTIYAIDASTIRVNKQNGKTMLDELTSIVTNVNAINVELTKSKLTKPAETVDNNISVWKNGQLYDGGINVANIVTLDTDQLITGKKAFSGEISFIGKTIFSDVVEVTDITIDGGKPYTDKNKPNIVDVGGISAITVGELSVNVENNIAIITPELIRLVLNADDILNSHPNNFATAEQGRKAETAYQKPQPGIPHTDMSEYVTKSLQLANTAVQTIPDATNQIKGVVTLGSKDGAARFGNKEDVGLGNVPNVNSQNATNINSGYLSLIRIADGLITAGNGITVTKDKTGVYTIIASNTIPYETNVVDAKPGNWTKVGDRYRFIISAETHKKGMYPSVEMYNVNGDRIYDTINVNRSNGNVTCYRLEPIATKIIIK